MLRVSRDVNTIPPADREGFAGAELALLESGREDSRDVMRGTVYYPPAVGTTTDRHPHGGISSSVLRVLSHRMPCVVCGVLRGLIILIFFGLLIIRA